MYLLPLASTSIGRRKPGTQLWHLMRWGMLLCRVKTHFFLPRFWQRKGPPLSECRRQVVVTLQAVAASAVACCRIRGAWAWLLFCLKPDTAGAAGCADKATWLRESNVNGKQQAGVTAKMLLFFCLRDEHDGCRHAGIELLAQKSLQRWRAAPGRATEPHLRQAKGLDLNYPLLCDPNGDVAYSDEPWSKLLTGGF